MSGPTTVLVGVDPITLLLSAAAIHAAKALAQGLEHAADERAHHRRDRQATLRAVRDARAQGQAALQQALQRAEQRFSQLVGVAESIGLGERLRAMQPDRPAQPDAESTARYVQSLETLTQELRSIVLGAVAERREALERAALDTQETAASDAETQGLGVTQAASLYQTLARDEDAAVGGVGQAPAPKLLAGQRLLARLAHLSEEPDLSDLPAELTALARTLDITPPGERADLLATELRRQVQAHLDAVQARQVQEATATVVAQCLEDLGYEVEGIGETLFVQGGVTHFRRPGWGDHMVRMRVAEGGAQANFNVVRAVDAATDEPSAQDAIAEDRWCTEFPALMHALAARGVQLEVTRRLEAGELPVQRVQRDKLPRFTGEEARPNVVAPLARPLG